MTKIPIAVQLYSVRDEAAKDLPGVLKAIAAMGYDGVEFAGYCGHTAEDVRRMLDDNGLKAAGTHTGLTTLLGDELERTVEFNQTIGNKFLIVPWLGEEYRNSADAWKRTAETFNEIDMRLLALGARTGYHNHDFEFKPIDGELPWDLFFGNTDHRVIMQFDTGNAMHGGGEALPFLERYPGRAVTVHLKEFSHSDPDALLGEGEVPFRKIMDACESQGATEWYIIEQEVYKYPPMECIKRCLDNLKKI